MMKARLLLQACLCIASLAQSAAVWPQQEVTAAELTRLQNSIEKIKAEITATRNQRSAVAAQLQQNEQDILSIQQALQQTTERSSATTAELEALQTQAAALEAQRLEQQVLIADYLKSARIAGNATTLKLLLNQDDPTVSSRMLRYYEFFSAARSERMQAYRSTLTAMQEVSSTIAIRSDELKAEQALLEQEAAALVSKQEQRLALLEQLDQSLETRGETLAALEQQRREIETLLEELRTSITTLNLGDADIPFAQRKGQLPWPVEGRVVNSFGSKHTLGDLTWEGMTLEAAAGTQVSAIHNGRVVFADWLGNSGLLLIIDHGDGFMSLYAHNQELYLTVGDWVSAGEHIAAVGNTGGQRSNALYFEIRRNGKAENPVSWCIARR